MTLLLASLVVFFACGAAAALFRGGRWASTALGAGGAALGACLGLAGTIEMIATGGYGAVRVAWGPPLDSLLFTADPLAALFLVPIFALVGLCAVYGAGYLGGARHAGFHWLQYNLLAAGMVMVVLAGDAIVFLLAWELMSLSSFLLVMHDGEEKRVREAGWIYLLAMHAGTAFLIVFFVAMGSGAGTYEFSAWGRSAVAPGGGILFAAACVGFGTKAGIVPLHVWLPEAHPAAPSHVSAVMSGVMIKTGVYGLMRALTFFTDIPPWWGTALVAAGVVSGILGVLFALAQHDLKRLLAYHSVENIGIIVAGLGLGVLGASTGNAALAALGTAGALLHVVNHAAFKGLLFMGAGAVAHAAGTREMDHAGGLLKRMPWTGAAFLVGAVAICGLPPLNGFVSEFLIYLGALGAIGGGKTFLSATGAAIGLALIGGLAVACFTKVFGVVFLGEPRHPAAAAAHEAGLLMRAPMAALAAACVIIGVLAPLAPALLAPAAAVVTGIPGAAAAQELAGAAAPLFSVTLVAGGLLALGALLWVVRNARVRRHAAAASPTWGCGYARPSARMQYTSSSFAQPVTSFFGLILRTQAKVTAVEGIFMRAASIETETHDMTRDGIYAPAFQLITRALSQLRRVQSGRVQLYVLYIAVTLLVLLVWTVKTQ